MKFIAVFALAFIAITTVHAVSLDEVPHKITEQVTQDLFDEFIRIHAKNYRSEVEQTYRMKVFADNLHFIANHNKQAAKGKHSFTLGVTPFADLTNEEYIQEYLPRSLEVDNSTIDLSDDDDIPHQNDYEALPEAALPSSVDWRKKGCVGSVRDQKSCGSCWAFAAAALIEGAVAQKTGKLYDVSEQQMVDCDKVSHGCNGGWTDAALRSVISSGGIQSESDYSYCACDRSCKFNKSKVKAKISSVTTVASGNPNENAIQSAVAERCGVSVYIYASAREFQLYKSGVFDLSSCSTSINHAVTVVGYDSSSGKPYWLVRNSWGKGWGDNGYIKMVRNKNMCGIGKYSYYASA